MRLFAKLHFLHALRLSRWRKALQNGVPVYSPELLVKDKAVTRVKKVRCRPQFAPDLVLKVASYCIHEVRRRSRPWDIPWRECETWMSAPVLISHKYICNYFGSV